MTAKPKILAISGSLRADSHNTKVLRVAAEGAAQAGAEVNFLDLRTLSLPMYDGDMHENEGVPDSVHRAKKLFETHDALLIASPEHNSTISAVLKNLIDWVSVSATPEEPMFHSFRGKIAAIMSTSPGMMGGLRGLFHLREILQNVMVMVIPSMQAVGFSHSAINREGRMADPEQQKKIEVLGSELAQLAARLRNQ